MRIAITGAAGRLGTELMRAFSDAAHSVIPLVRPAFSLERPSLPAGVDLVVNAAAWTDVDACARDPERSMLLNGLAAGRLAQLAHAAGSGFVQISTNEVFSGKEPVAYSEDSPTDPINAYGLSKLAGEKAVRAAYYDAIIIRTAWIFGGPNDFPSKVLLAAKRMARETRPLPVVADETGNPTPARLLADRIADLAALEEPPRVLHLAGDPPVSRFEWATRILSGVGVPVPEPISRSAYQRASEPPAHAVLATDLARSLGLSIDWKQES